MNIIVFGSSGQLGKTLKQYFKSSKYDFDFYSKDDLDITNKKLLKKEIESKNPKIIINCSAYTNVDKAENNKTLANKINNVAVANLSRLCYENNSFLIHFSTDYVFDGLSKDPYKEEDHTGPVGVYGNTKLKGEKAITKSGCNYFIVRTSWVFSEYGKNFLKTIINLSKKNNYLNIVSDQYGSPTYTWDIAKLLDKMIPYILTKTTKNSIFHFSGAPFCSWYDFANVIIEHAKKNNLVNHSLETKKILTKDFETIAVRPKNSMLNSDKVCKQFKVSPSDWVRGVRNALSRLNEV